MLSHAQNLASIRAAKGLTQARVAALAGLTQANLSKIESGRQDPALSTFVRICVALGVAPAEVLKRRVADPAPRSRRAAEAIAEAVVGGRPVTSPADAEIAALLKDALPSGRFSSRRARASWIRLKARVTPGELRSLLDRIEDRRGRS